MSRAPYPSRSPDHEATNYIKGTFTSHQPNSEHRPHKISVPQTGEAVGGSSEAATLERKPGHRESEVAAAERWALEGQQGAQPLCPALGYGPLGQEVEGRPASWS